MTQDVSDPPTDKPAADAISRMGGRLWNLNPIRDVDDPWEATQVMLAHIYAFWNRKADTLEKSNDYHNKVLVRGMLSGVMATYKLVHLTRGLTFNKRRKRRGSNRSVHS